MRQHLILWVLAGVLATAGYSDAQQGYQCDLGPRADDAAATAYVVAEGWDVAGDPRPCMTYWDTGAEKARCWDATGAGDWIDCPANASVAGDASGTLGALVVTNDSHDHGNSTLDGVPGAAIDTTALHSGDTGAALTYIDQDVTSGSSPTFDGSNFTGLPSAGGLFSADFSTAWDATSTPTGPSGWTASAGNGALGDWTTLGFSGGDCVVALSSPGATKTALLDYDLDAAGYAGMREQSALRIVIAYSVTTMGGSGGHPAWHVRLGNDDDAEMSFIGMNYDGSTHRSVFHAVVRNGGGAASQSVNDASYNVANSAILVARTSDESKMRRYEPTGDGEIAPTDIAANAHVRDGAMRLRLLFEVDSAGEMELAIHSITIAGLQ